jgi:flagellin-like protein
VNNKKGISPLIATVLIIGFTIVLAVLVITWISGTVEDTTTETDCMADAQKICLDSIGVIQLSEYGANLIVVNEGADVIDSITIVQYDGTGASTGTNVIEDLAAYGTNNTIRIEQGIVSVKAFITAEGNDGECSVECSPVELTL